MNQDDIKVGTVVRKKNMHTFGGRRTPEHFTATIERIVEGYSPDLDQVWFNTLSFMHRFECANELESVLVPTDDEEPEPEDSTSRLYNPCTEISLRGDDELTGGSVDYYKAWVESPTSGGAPYELEVNDFAEAFELNYAEATIVKAIARLAQLRREAGKPGSTARYEAEKQLFFAERVLIQNT